MPPITEAQLDNVAEEAAILFVNGQATDATDAVVKAASTLGPHLTGEHVRRVCEKTYRGIFERKHKEASAGDRFVTFDPPRADLAAQRLTAAKVASATQIITRASHAAAGRGTEKVAEAAGPKPYSPTNVFDLVTQQTMRPPPKLSSLPDLQAVTRDLRHTLGELENRKIAAEGTSQLLLLELVSEAKTCIASGMTTDDVVLLGADGVVEARPDLPTQFVEKAADYLIRGLLESGVPRGAAKLASIEGARINLSHPLVVRFEKFASSLFDCAVVDAGLAAVRPEFRRAQEGLRALAASR